MIEKCIEWIEFTHVSKIELQRDCFIVVTVLFAREVTEPFDNIAGQYSFMIHSNLDLFV